MRRRTGVQTKPVDSRNFGPVNLNKVTTRITQQRETYCNTHIAYTIEITVNVT